MNDALPRELTDDLDRAYRRMLHHAENLFVETEDVTTSFTQWDDGDFQLEAYHGFDTRRDDMHHGEQITYKHSEGYFKYANFTREFGWHNDRAFREYKIETWSP